MFTADDRNEHKPQDRSRQPLATVWHTTILISAPQWACWPCNAPTQFYTVGKKPSVKADLAIYSQAVDVRGRCMSESLILGHNLDFSSCDIMVSFRKSSHICSNCPESCSIKLIRVNRYTEEYLYQFEVWNILIIVLIFYKNIIINKVQICMLEMILIGENYRMEGNFGGF